MKILLQRTQETDNSVLGELYINDKLFAYTLEDKIREVKIKHETCIPEGTYKVIMNMSARFKTILPLLLDVPNFEGIRIHAGNTIEDTSGCILLGTSISKDTLLHSKVAIAKFLPILKNALRQGEVIIDVRNPVKKEVPVEIISEKPIEQVEPEPVVVQEPQPTKFTILTFIQWLIKFFSKKS